MQSWANTRLTNFQILLDFSKVFFENMLVYYLLIYLFITNYSSILNKISYDDKIKKSFLFEKRKNIKF